MPRYFFHSEDGVFHPDEEGSELPDLAAARREATLVLGELLREFNEEFWAVGERGLIVADAEGAVLFTLRVVANDGAAGTNVG